MRDLIVSWHCADPSGMRRLIQSGDPGSSVRATTRLHTRTAPCFRSTCASASRVAPVVITSSITRIGSSRERTMAANASRMFPRLAVQGSETCGAVSTYVCKRNVERQAPGTRQRTGKLDRLIESPLTQAPRMKGHGQDQVDPGRRPAPREAPAKMGCHGQPRLVLERLNHAIDGERVGEHCAGGSIGRVHGAGSDRIRHHRESELRRPGRPRCG
jgi:hypothetical protein